jgi:hypothetical protein
MSEIEARLDALIARLTESPNESAERLDYTSAWEAGVRHPVRDTFLLCRDDGVAEVTSGLGASLTVDGDQAQINLASQKLSLAAKDIHLHTEQLWFGHKRFDPTGWWTGLGMVDFFTPTWNGPLVGNDFFRLRLLLDSPLLVGDPASIQYTIPGEPGGLHVPGTGQQNLKLQNHIHPQPLLGPDEFLFTLTQKMMDILQALDKHA